MPAANRKSEYGKSGSCPKVSAERFDELVSLYLDKEASAAELELLSKLVQSDEEAMAVFKKSCNIHLATCKMFGKTCVLTRLPGLYMPRRKRISRRRAIAEWSMVAAFMLISVAMFKISADISSSDIAAAEYAEAELASDADSKFEVLVSDSFVSRDESCSIFIITPKKP